MPWLYFYSCLLNHAASYTSAAAAQRSGLVGIIVATRMNNDSAALDILNGQIGSVQLALDFTLGIGSDGGQVALVAVLDRAFMLASFIGVKMTASRQASYFLAVFFSRSA